MRLVPVAEATASQLERARAFYEDSFPDELLVPFESLFADVALVYLDDDEQAVGFVCLRPMPSRGWLFLRYFVAGERGRGIGSLMWRAMTDHFADVPRIALDVEDPDEPDLEAAELQERRRRVAFYERLDVVLLPVRGYRPPHDGEEPHLHPMLWTRSGPSAIDPPDPDDVRDVVLAIFRDRYGLPTDDPAVVATLRASGLES